jgi:hypothetical protein
MILRHRIATLGLSLVSLSVLISCGNSSEYLEKLQTQIQQEVSKQGGNSLKSVICAAAPKADQPPQCVGVLDSGSGFDIEVQQKEDKSYNWKIPSVNGLLNMVQVQTTIQDGLKAAVGEGSLDCGATQAYRAVKPGESFDCQFKPNQPTEAAKTEVTKAEAAKTEAAKTEAAKVKDAAKDQKTAPIKLSNQPEKVVVTILPSGDVNWQRITPIVATGKPDAKAADPSNPAKANSKSDKLAGDAQTESTSQSSADKAVANQKSTTGQPAPEAAKSADDFLNQAGATDDF